MAGCAHLGKRILIVFAILFTLGLLLIPTRCTSDGKGYINLKVLNVLITLREGLHSYDAEYGRYPVDQSHTTGDLKTTSRGLLISLLMGSSIQGLNEKEIVFCEFKVARNHRDGIWQDGKEWVLSDYWGQEYEVVLDADNNGHVSNPDIRESGQVPTLSSRIAIFSAGPDGDPATWDDNVKSWK
jgi:hypothetical protein